MSSLVTVYGAWGSETGGSWTGTGGGSSVGVAGASSAGSRSRGSEAGFSGVCLCAVMGLSRLHDRYRHHEDTKTRRHEETKTRRDYAGGPLQLGPTQDPSLPPVRPDTLTSDRQIVVLTTPPQPNSRVVVPSRSNEKAVAHARAPSLRVITVNRHAPDREEDGPCSSVHRH